MPVNEAIEVLHRASEPANYLTVRRPGSMRTDVCQKLSDLYLLVGCFDEVPNGRYCPGLYSVTSEGLRGGFVSLGGWPVRTAEDAFAAIIHGNALEAASAAL